MVSLSSRRGGQLRGESPRYSPVVAVLKGSGASFHHIHNINTVITTFRSTTDGICDGGHMRLYNSTYYWFHFLIWYRVSQEECARLRECVPYVKIYRYNPKHLYPKLNGYGDNGQRILKI